MHLDSNNAWKSVLMRLHGSRIGLLSQLFWSWSLPSFNTFLYSNNVTQMLVTSVETLCKALTDFLSLYIFYFFFFFLCIRSWWEVVRLGRMELLFCHLRWWNPESIPNLHQSSFSVWRKRLLRSQSRITIMQSKPMPRFHIFHFIIRMKV